MVYQNNKNDDEEVIMDTEVEGDDVELEEEEEGLKDKIAVLRAKLKACEEEKQLHLEELQRARADFLNSRRRLEEQSVRDKERAGDKILSEVLTLIDSFDIAMSDTEVWATIDERWRSGIEAIHAKLMSIVQSNKVEVIHPLKEAFNPEEHEAVSNIAVENDEDVDKVMAVLQKGFKRNGTIIRPARVVVGAK